MEYLISQIKSRALVLQCPNCQSVAWVESGLGQGLLHCNNCWMHTSLIEWISSISSSGDDDPYICLRMTRSDGKLSIQVDISKRNSYMAEHIRFCVIAGQRSPHLTESLAHLLDRYKKISPTEIHFTGSGGQFKIFRRHGFLDIWAKTEDILKEESSGTTVWFGKEDKATPLFEGLIAAMLEDMKDRSF